MEETKNLRLLIKVFRFESDKLKLIKSNKHLCVSTTASYTFTISMKFNVNAYEARRKMNLNAVFM